MKLKSILLTAVATISLATATMAQVPNYVPTNGLVGWWPFNGNANDESGNGNNGIVYPNTTLTDDRFSNSNNAYLFDNSVQSGIQTNNPLTYTNTGISGSLWFNTNVFLNASAGHRQFISGTNGIPFQFAYNNGGVDLEVYNQSGGLTVFTWPSIFIPNSWHHVAFSVNTNGSVLISIDGQVYNLGSSPNSLRTANNSTYIFGLSSSAFWPNPFSGKLDDIAIYNRALTQQEITALYTGIAAPTTSCLPAYVPTNGLVGYWPFCGNANDESGNGNNGTVNGATLTSDRNGNANSAYDFNGSSNINISNSNIAAFLFSSFSCGAWFKTSSSSPGDIIRYDNCVTGSGWGLRIGYNNSGQIQGLEFDNSRNPNFVTSNNLYNNGNWHFVLYKRDISLMKDFLFIDNQLISETTFSSVFNIELTGHPLFIGAGCDFFNGDLDDIAIYNRALTQQEITALYTDATTCVPPVATVTPASSTTFCSGGSVVLNANSDASFSYQWQLNGANITGATNAGYTANASGNYSVIISNATNCADTSATTAVTVNALPTASITAATAATFCTGGSVVLNANTGTGLNYQWKNNGNNISGATSASYTASTTGSYTAVVTNGNGCSATSTATAVTVNPPPTATITAGGATTFCQGGSVLLNANSGTGLTYQWRNNGNNISGATNSSYTANASGSYTLVVTNSNGCSATSTSTAVTVNPSPTATITAGGATTFCQGGSLVLNANSGASLTYQWKNNGNNISGATNASYTANASGSYAVVVTNSNGCSATSTSTAVTVNPSPTVSISGLSNFTNYNANPVSVNGNPSGGSFTGPGISGTSFNPQAAGLGSSTITYSYINGNGCSNTATQNTIVYDTLGVVCTSYDTITTNVFDTTFVTQTVYDTIQVTVYDTLLTTVTDTLIINSVLTGINPPNNLNTLKVFPNPANTHITINYGNFSSMSGYTLTIVNSIGQTVFTTPINQQSSYIDLSTWSGNGIYFVQLIDPQNNTIENRKIVIQ